MTEQGSKPNPIGSEQKYARRRFMAEELIRLGPVKFAEAIRMVLGAAESQPSTQTKGLISDFMTRGFVVQDTDKGFNQSVALIMGVLEDQEEWHEALDNKRTEQG